MPKRKRNIELAKFYRERPCIVCGDESTVAGDHIKTFGSGGECCHENMWSLCFRHHREKEDNGLTTFVNNYPKLKVILKSKGWEFEEFTGKWIRLTVDGWDA